MELLTLLQRIHAAIPIVSVVPVTYYEIQGDIHKDGHREFFSKNYFFDLLDDSIQIIFDENKKIDFDRLSAAVASSTQRIRNKFLSYSPNGTNCFQDYFGPDPISKDLMRAAAMAKQSIEQSNKKGIEYDLEKGLDFISYVLISMSKEDNWIDEINSVLSSRRGARNSSVKHFNTEQILFISELILDKAMASIPEINSVNGISKKRSEEFSTSDSEIQSPFNSLEAQNFKTNEMLPSNSTLAFFADRFAGAFPGVRSITWYKSPSEIKQRLSSLLSAPLVFKNSHPLWYWRQGNLHIAKFFFRDDDIAIMNNEELNIKFVAAIPGPTYKYEFVYVETESMEPTGLYDYCPQERAERLNHSGYLYESYGVFLGSHKFTRAEFDDGATVIDGVLIDTRGKSESRVRYTTPYNFIIAPQGSPVNTNTFDLVLSQYLNRALKEDRESVVEELAERIFQLPLTKVQYLPHPEQ